MDDENTSHLAEDQIDRQRRGAHMEVRDNRLSGLIRWVWAVIGSVAVMVGLGVYNKLSSINDTLITAVGDIKNQAAQTADLKSEVRDLRHANSQLQRQVDGLSGKLESLEGKTLRGIEEMKHGR